jgi:hypothetical protein
VLIQDPSQQFDYFLIGRPSYFKRFQAFGQISPNEEGHLSSIEAGIRAAGVNVRRISGMKFGIG